MSGRHFEIQLGHLCNDRCVFCISGRRTAEGRAPLLAEDMVLTSIRAGWAAGHRTLTLLGGEPTIQPVFLPAVREAVALGYEKIVIFSNGSKLGRTDLMDQVLATGGRFEWRFSVHGATQEAHEDTTGRRGSFAQLMRSIARAHERGQEITTNTCVVLQNHASLVHLPALLAPFRVRHVHVDMIHPEDTGDILRYHGDAVLRATLGAMVPRYRDIVGSLTHMVQNFPEGFPVSIGNLPFCVAPHLAPWIHHAGEDTYTVTVDDTEDHALHASHDKYRGKHTGSCKSPACSTCVFDARCRGFFEDYRFLFGLDELKPVTPAMLRVIDPRWRSFAHHAQALATEAAAGWIPPPPFAPPTLDCADERALTLSFAQPRALPVRVVLRPDRHGVAAGAACGLHVLDAPCAPEALLGLLRALWARLVAAGLHSDHPPGEDSVGLLSGPLASVLARLRARAPFGALAWVALAVDPRGLRAELTLRGPAGEEATAWVGPRTSGPSIGYTVAPGTEASPALVAGLRAFVGALRSLPTVPADHQAGVAQGGWQP